MARRTRLSRKLQKRRKSTKPRLIYWKGVYQNTGTPPSPEQRATMANEAESVRRKILKLLDFWSLKNYKGEKVEDRENLTVVVLAPKQKHFKFMQAYTDWKAHGFWQENGKVFDEGNKMFEVQFADTEHEHVGKDLMKLLNAYNNLVVGEKSLYAYTTPIEETTLE